MKVSVLRNRQYFVLRTDKPLRVVFLLSTGVWRCL